MAEIVLRLEAEDVGVEGQRFVDVADEDGYQGDVGDHAHDVKRGRRRRAAGQDNPLDPRGPAHRGERGPGVLGEHEDALVRGAVEDIVRRAAPGEFLAQLDDGGGQALLRHVTELGITVRTGAAASASPATTLRLVIEAETVCDMATSLARTTERDEAE